MKTEIIKVNICPMTGTDIIEIKKMEEDHNLSHWSIDDYYSEIDRADSISLTAKINKRTVGFAVARLIMSADPTSYEIEIYNICVIREFRRKNIGKNFIETFIKIPDRHVVSVWVDVRESNNSALAFYNKLNFRTIHRRKNFYRNPTEDGLVLKMKL